MKVTGIKTHENYNMTLCNGMTNINDYCESQYVCTFQFENTPKSNQNVIKKVTNLLNQA